MYKERSPLYQKIILFLIRFAPDSISNLLYLKNIYWIRSLSENKSSDTYLDMSKKLSKYISSPRQTKAFVKLISKEIKLKEDLQHIIIDFTSVLFIDDYFIEDSCNALVSSEVITKDMIENSIIIILGEEFVKDKFEKYFDLAFKTL